MTQHDALEDGFRQTIPGCANKGDDFLQEIYVRCAVENISGIQLDFATPDRGGGVVLRGPVRVEVTRFKESGRPLFLQVNADPAGSDLDCSWELITGAATGDDVAYPEDVSAERRSQALGLCNRFHETIFMPILQEIADAAQATAS
jgi:hypothetical protein